MGQLLSLVVLLVLQFFVLTPEQLHDWGWRIPFFIGAIAALVALWLRRSIDETDAFKKATPTREAKAGQLEVLVKYPREVLTVIGLTMGGTLFFYVFTTYMQQYLANTVGLSKNDATLVSASGLFIFMLLQPAMGALSDRIGRRTMLIIFGVLALFSTVPLLSALEQTKSALTAFLLVTTGLAISSFYSSISAIVKAELFPVEIRALGVGLPYSIAVSIFGGFAPLIGLKFKEMGHESWFYWFVTACVFCSLLVYIFMRETQKTSRIE
jgi:MHS family alpha-ketoglutarate permease-like MFS transporter